MSRYQAIIDTKDYQVVIEFAARVAHEAMRFESEDIPNWYDATIEQKNRARLLISRLIAGEALNAIGSTDAVMAAAGAAILKCAIGEYAS